MAKVLFVRAEWNTDGDIATKYLAAYGALLVQKASEWGHQVTDLYKELATLENFEREMLLNDIFIGLSHGNSTTFTGQKMNEHIEILLKDTVNADICSGKPCYIAACSTGASLGPKMVEKTCPQFYGYQSDWIFIYNPDFYRENRILEDPWAQAFFDSALTTGYAILLGKSPLEVYETTLQRYDYWWDYWIKQNDPMADDILTWLNWDKQGFIAITPDGVYSKSKASIPSIAGIAIPLGIAAISLFLLSNKNVLTDESNKQ